MVFCPVDCSLSAGLCLALQVSSPSFHSARPDLSLSRPFLLQPLATGAIPLARVVPRHLLVAYLLVSLRSVRLSSGLLFPTFLVGYSSSAFPWCPSSPFFWFVRGVGWSSWLSPLPSARLWIVVFSVPCGLVGASATFPAALHPASLCPIGCSTASSLGARRCVLSLTLGFSIPLPVSSSWALLSRFLSSAAYSSPRYSLWLLDPAFLLLLCASSSSLLAACLWFLFLGTAFPGPQYVPRFSFLLFWP